MKAIRYVGLSLAVHAGLAVLFLLLRAPQPAQTEESRVILQFQPVDMPLSRARQARPQTAAASAGRGVLVPFFPPGEDIAAPAPGPADGTAAAGSSRRIAAENPAAPAPPDRLVTPALPDPAAVLEQVRAQAADPGAKETAAPSGESELVWSGSGRRLLRQGNLRFPDILLQEGQEVDVEASFLVSPEGRVTKIEITRSSGYIIVDRAIERALSEYLFEGSATGEMESGLIRFHFRLERVD
jgi:TonB family protein